MEVAESDRRTVRELTQTQSILLLEIFERIGVPATATEYTENHEQTGQQQSVNGTARSN